jgi:O-antigen/teichoic acid export membrane protein
MRFRLIEGAGLAFVLQVAGVGTTYILHVVLARWLGSDGYGLYAYILAWSTLLATAAALGLPLAALRFVSQHLAAERWGDLRGTLWGVPALVSLGGVIVSLISLGVLSLLGMLSSAWSFGLACVPLLALVALGTDIARGMGSVLGSMAPSRLLRPVAVLILILVAFRREPAVDRALLATAGGLLLVIAFQWIWIQVLCPAAARESRPVFMVRQWLKTGFPMMLSIGASLLLTQTDLLMVGLLLDERSAGLYSAAARTASVIPMILYSFNVAAAPKFAALYDAGDRDGLQGLASMVVKGAFLPSVFSGLLIGGASIPILSLFGEEFVEARGVLVVLISGYVFTSGVGSVGYLLNLTGHERDNARVVVYAAAINVLLNLALISVWGIIGASFASVLAWLYAGLSLHRLAQSRVGVDASIVAALK